MAKSRHGCKGALGQLLGKRCDTPHLSGHYQLPPMAPVSLTHTACLGMDSVPTAMLMSPGNSLGVVHR